MKALLCSQYCGPDDLVLADLPDPVAEAGQAVIAIKSAALNFFDLLMIQGKVPDQAAVSVFAGGGSRGP